MKLISQPEADYILGMPGVQVALIINYSSIYNLS